MEVVNARASCVRYTLTSSLAAEEGSAVAIQVTRVARALGASLERLEANLDVRR